MPHVFAILKALLKLNQYTSHTSANIYNADHFRDTHPNDFYIFMIGMEF